MPISGFHSEWFSYKDHRMYLYCRTSFPNKLMRRIAKVAVKTCDIVSRNANWGKAARVTNIYFDDKAAAYFIYIATTDPQDTVIKDILEAELQAIFQGEENSISVLIVEIAIFESSSLESSENYNHMEYLSVKSDIAVDRWKHEDSEYQKSIHPPD